MLRCLVEKSLAFFFVYLFVSAFFFFFDFFFVFFLSFLFSLNIRYKTFGCVCVCEYFVFVCLFSLTSTLI